MRHSLPAPRRSRRARRVTARLLVAAALVAASGVPAPAAAAWVQTAPPAHTDVTQGSTAFTPRIARVDINGAASRDLQLLKGVGPKRAAAIIAGRPYRSAGELVERGIIPADMFDRLKADISIGP
jgi:DNA uptake protein ComE-like DNA-binding protein